MPPYRCAAGILSLGLLAVGPARAAPPDGAALYWMNCASCHQPDGRGLAGAIPPLARSDYLHADVRRAIGVVLGGASGSITVNGSRFAGVMPAFDHLADGDVAAVLSWVLQEWGNSGPTVMVRDVGAVRSARGAVKLDRETEPARAGHRRAHRGGLGGAGHCRGMAR